MTLMTLAGQEYGCDHWDLRGVLPEERLSKTYRGAVEEPHEKGVDGNNENDVLG